MVGLSLATIAACAGKTPSAESYKGLGAESLSPELVKKYTPPAVEGAWLSRVQKLLDLRGAAGRAVLSPDGRILYYTSSVTGVSQVWRIEGPFSYPRQMTGGADSTSVVTVLPNGRDLIISRDRNGEENPGLYLQSAKGGALREIYHQKKVQASAAYVTNDSRYLYFTANSEKPESYAIHRYDLKSGERKVVFSEPGTWMVADVRDDREFLLVKATGSIWREYSLWNAQTGELKPLLGQGEKEEYDMSFAPDKGAYLVVTPKFGEFRRLYLYKDGKFTPAGPNRQMDLESLAIDRARQRVYLGWNDQGYSRLQVLNARTLKPENVSRIPGADHVYVMNLSRDGRYAVIGASDATKPQTLYVKDWRTGSFTRWMDPNLPEVDTTKFAAAKLEYYPTRDGAKVPMFVRRPAVCQPAPCPVVVNFHGGPEGQSRPGFSPTAQMFVDAGFVYVEPNVRGSDGYGKSWLGADDGPKRLKVITDLEDAATALKKEFTVGGKVPKIGVMGGSYGGYATQYAMTRFAGAYDAGVAIVGMSNLITFLNNTAPYRRHLRTSEYGDPDKDREALVELSPVTHIRKIKGPMLLIQGLNDPRVPAGEAVQMHDILTSKGLPSELIIYADEGHGSAKRDNRANQLAHTLRFFEKHLR
ncbi:MAG: S9 family peptidase [Bdellovibrionaceae bacterium]|nr:S9 family peptidase [Pseudobdellovibrionaceae bacterium]